MRYLGFWPPKSTTRFSKMTKALNILAAAAFAALAIALALIGAGSIEISFPIVAGHTLVGALGASVAVVGIVLLIVVVAVNRLIK